MLKENDVIKVNKDIQGTPIKKGQTGTIVMVHTHPSVAYEVEFLDSEGYTIGVATIKPEEIKQG